MWNAGRFLLLVFVGRDTIRESSGKNLQGDLMGRATRALERDEIHRLFESIDGKFAVRNQTMLICGIAMALRATELVSLNVGDVRDRNQRIKANITILEMTHSLKEYSDSDLFIELQKRGHDMSETLERQHRRELKTSKVVSIDAVRTAK